jgi:hypothetical protein
MKVGDVIMAFDDRYQLLEYRVRAVSVTALEWTVVLLATARMQYAIRTSQVREEDIVPGNFLIYDTYYIEDSPMAHSFTSADKRHHEGGGATDEPQAQLSELDLQKVRNPRLPRRGGAPAPAPSAELPLPPDTWRADRAALLAGGWPWEGPNMDKRFLLELWAGTLSVELDPNAAPSGTAISLKNLRKAQEELSQPRFHKGFRQRSGPPPAQVSQSLVKVFSAGLVHVREV